MKTWLITLLILLAIYEVFEHLILPLFWMIRCRGRKPAFGPSGMIGKTCVVKQWNGTCGKVQIGSELWNAYGESPLSPGAEAVIQDIKGLSLKVSPSEISIKTI